MEIPRLPTTMAMDHARDALIYVSALGWTNALLPSLGGPTMRSVPELMHHKFYYGGAPIFLVFVWVYTFLLAGFCFWCYKFAAQHAEAVHRSNSNTPTLPEGLCCDSRIYGMLVHNSACPATHGMCLGNELSRNLSVATGHNASVVAVCR